MKLTQPSLATVGFETQRKRPSVRIGELDALRGLAAFAVMLYHYTTLYDKNIGHIETPAFGFAAGNYGVQLFFLISGFVIFMTLEKIRTGTDFVVSRFSRLYPAYWAAVATSAAFVYTIGLPEQRLSTGALLVNLTMFQQILQVAHLDGSYWTLQIELFFYIQMLFWYLTGQLQRIRWIIAVWLVVVLGYYLADAHHVHVSWTLGQLLILEHIPFFSIGILFYQLYNDAQRRSWHDHALVAASICVIAATREPVYVVVALFCTAVFYLFIYGGLRWLAARPFAFLGTISYSLYLLHQVIGFDAIWHLEHDAHISGTLSVFLAIALSIALATVLTRLVEQPAMRWIRRRWKTYRSGAEVKIGATDSEP